jgi:hypothetical protein
MSECISISVVRVFVSLWLSGNQYVLPLRRIKKLNLGLTGMQLIQLVNDEMKAVPIESN